MYCTLNGNEDNNYVCHQWMMYFAPLLKLMKDYNVKTVLFLFDLWAGNGCGLAKLVYPYDSFIMQQKNDCPVILTTIILNIFQF